MSTIKVILEYGGDNEESISLYYEISVSDLYLISAVTNHLKPSDVLRLSFGIKSDIF